MEYRKHLRECAEDLRLFALPIAFDKLCAERIIQLSRGAQMGVGFRFVVPLTVITVMLTGALSAQWLSYPTAGIPRTPDGKPNLNAPVPRTPDGKPQLAGLWKPNPGLVGDVTRSFKNGEVVPFQPWADTLYKQRRASNSKDDPTANCIVGGTPRSDFVGYPFKILQVPGMVVILYEAVHAYRQIFTDGRPFPKDMNPTWQGYSVGHWEGDTFVVETKGFNDKGWLDTNGHPVTDALHVTERYTRKDFGHMDVAITIDDPKAYTRPWTVVEPAVYQPDTELIEYICEENNKDPQHIVGR
jgi:hypothetical protein